MMDGIWVTRDFHLALSWARKGRKVLFLAGDDAVPFELVLQAMQGNLVPESHRDAVNRVLARAFGGG